MKLEEFNRIDRNRAFDALRPCVDIARWIDGIVNARPYSSVEELLTVARETARPWTEVELDGALAHHPRIGERASGASVEASLSRSEQAGVDPKDAEINDALAAGNRAYEDKFGRVFLIRAAGRSAQEILATLQSRLKHSSEDEIPVIAEQMREIALLRLKGTVTA